MTALTSAACEQIHISFQRATGRTQWLTSLLSKDRTRRRRYDKTQERHRRAAGTNEIPRAANDWFRFAAGITSSPNASCDMVVLERHERDRRQEKIERKGRKRRASDSEASLGARYPHQGHGPLKITGSGASKRKRREPEEQDKDEDVEQGETEDDSEDGDAAGGRKKSTGQSSTCPHCKKVLVNGVTKRHLATASCEKARQLARLIPVVSVPIIAIITGSLAVIIIIIVVVVSVTLLITIAVAVVVVGLALIRRIPQLAESAGASSAPRARTQVESSGRSRSSGCKNDNPNIRLADPFRRYHEEEGNAISASLNSMNRIP